jgi:uridine kinase
MAITKKSFDEAIECLLYSATHLLSSLITVSGGTQSGKTFFSTTLQNALLKHELIVPVVSLDNYFRDHDDPALPRDSDGGLLFDLPQAYHSFEFAQDVSKLLHHQSVFAPIYLKSENRRMNGVTTLLHPSKASNVVIAEGLFAQTFLSDVPSAVHIYMDTPIEMCLKRRIETDVTEYKVTAQEVERFFRKKTLPYWEEHVAPQKNHANIVITP